MTSEDDGELASRMIFEVMASELPNHSKALAKTKGLLVFHILKSGKERAVFTVDLRSPPGEIYEGKPKTPGKPSAIITVEDENYAALALGEIEPIQAFMSGKVKARGDVLLLQKLSAIMKGARQSLL